MSTLNELGEAIENVGCDLEHTDTVNLSEVRRVCRVVVEYLGNGMLELDDTHEIYGSCATLVKEAIRILDDATITSDDPDADAIVTRDLLAAVEAS